jgi:hypothetical protein
VKSVDVEAVMAHHKPSSRESIPLCAAGWTG